MKEQKLLLILDRIHHQELVFQKFASLLELDYQVKKILFETINIGIKQTISWVEDNYDLLCKSPWDYEHKT